MKETLNINDSYIIDFRQEKNTSTTKISLQNHDSVIYLQINASVVHKQDRLQLYYIILIYTIFLYLIILFLIHLLSFATSDIVINMNIFSLGISKKVCNFINNQ